MSLELRVLFLLLVAFGLDVYTYQAVRAWSSPWQRPLRRGVRIAYWGLSALAIAFFLLNIFRLTASWPDGVKQFLRVGLFLFWICKLPVVLLLLLDDFRRGATAVLNRVSPVSERDTGRSRFIAKMALLAGGLPLATLTYGIVRNAYRYRRFAVEVPIANLPAALDGLKIVQISDMHSGSWTRKTPLYDAVQLINAEAPDLVCFTGDIVNSQAKEMQPFIEIFREIKARHGVFSVLGNHDYGDYHDWPTPEDKAANRALLYQTHADLGWELLRNEHRVLEIAGHKLGLIGVENWGAALRFPRKGDLAKATKDMGPCDCQILLSHDPTHWDAKVRPGYPAIDLTLSGHTHGFQFGIEIPGFRWSPAQYLYKQWAGLYREGRQHLYVNRGLGFLGYPGRVGILPEVTVLTLRQAIS